MEKYIVNSFTGYSPMIPQCYQGNPAGVVVLDKWLDDNAMQAIAEETALSETAFCVKESDSFGIRWFTPKCEVNLCGHATLATSFILSKYYYPQLGEFIFLSKSGELRVRRLDGKDIFEMDLPIREVVKLDICSAKSCESDSCGNGNEELLDTIERIIETSLPTATMSSGAEDVVDKIYLCNDLVLLLKNERFVRNFSPCMEAISALKNVEGLVITAVSESPFDFVSRCFYPNEGIDEDPVTGSAHCALIPIWEEKLGKRMLLAYQASSRGGVICGESRGDRVIIRGEATLAI